MYRSYKASRFGCKLWCAINIRYPWRQILTMKSTKAQQNKAQAKEAKPQKPKKKQKDEKVQPQASEWTGEIVRNWHK